MCVRRPDPVDTRCRAPQGAPLAVVLLLGAGADWCAGYWGGTRISPACRPAVCCRRPRPSMIAIDIHIDISANPEHRRAWRAVPRARAKCPGARCHQIINVAMDMLIGRMYWRGRGGYCCHRGCHVSGLPRHRGCGAIRLVTTAYMGSAAIGYTLYACKPTVERTV